MGETPADDKVVGIADFIIIPYGQAVEDVYNATQKIGSDLTLNGISSIKMYQLFSGALSQASNGISGCVSIEHFLQAADDLQKAQKK